MCAGAERASGFRSARRIFGVGYENHTSHPAPGHVILYPGGISETEILLAYGGVAFSSKMGQLAGNHFITLTGGLENLATLGNKVLWEGAQPIRFEEGLNAVGPCRA